MSIFSWKFCCALVKIWILCMLKMVILVIEFEWGHFYCNTLYITMWITNVGNFSSNKMFPLLPFQRVVWHFCTPNIHDVVTRLISKSHILLSLQTHIIARYPVLTCVLCHSLTIRCIKDEQKTTVNVGSFAKKAQH